MMGRKQGCGWKLTVIAGVLGTLLSGCALSPVLTQSGDDRYEGVSRGSYRGSYYTVQKGDTLYFISYITDKDVNDLISYNDLEKPYTIFPGQRIRLWRPRYVAPKYGESTTKTATAPAQTVDKKTVPIIVPPAKPPVKPEVAKKNTASNATANSAKVIPSAHNTDHKVVDSASSQEYSQQRSKQNVNKSSPPPNKNAGVATEQKASAPVEAKPKPKPVSKPATKPKANVSSKSVDWDWPTKGRVVGKFSDAINGNKGIDIAGQRGQPIQATADGTVVYAGNALRGYGNLIIIKHNDDYLSAYAHNDQLFVRENQTVKSGQKIATMGSSGAQSVKLHFEIRYKGKSVDPLRYLN